MNRRLLEVGEIHGNLREAAHKESCALYIAESTAGKSHCLGDPLGKIHIRSIQEHIVGNEKLTRSHYRRARRGVDSRIAKIRPSRGIRRDLVANALKLPAADVL